MKQKCWKMRCAKFDKDIGFGIECFACESIERPTTARTDARLCIHERYIEEIEREV